MDIFARVYSWRVMHTGDKFNPLLVGKIVARWDRFHVASRVGESLANVGELLRLLDMLEKKKKKNWIYKDSISKTGKEEDHKKKEEEEEEKEEEESSSDSNHKKRQPLATWNLDLICIRNAELRERKGTQPNNA